MKVRAITTAVVGLDDGTSVNIRENDSFDKTDPVVKQHGWLFERDNIEQATAAPGETRNARVRG